MSPKRRKPSTPSKSVAKVGNEKKSDTPKPKKQLGEEEASQTYLTKRTDELMLNPQTYGDGGEAGKKNCKICGETHNSKGFGSHLKKCTEKNNDKAREIATEKLKELMKEEAEMMANSRRRRAKGERGRREAEIGGGTADKGKSGQGGREEQNESSESESSGEYCDPEEGGWTEG